MQVIDITYPIHEGMFKYPSDPEVEIIINKAKTIAKDEIIYDESGFTSGAGFSVTKYKSGNISLNIRNHHGTHINAPAHKIEKGKTIEQYDINKFINHAKLIDLTAALRKKREINIEDIKDSDKNIHNSEIKALIFYTGFCDEIARNEGKLKGEEKIKFEKTFPYFNIKSAEYIVEKYPELNIVGIDSFAVDPSGSNSEVHRIFFERDILPLETLVNLNELRNGSNKEFMLNCVPVAYSDSDAAQTRVYAIIK